MKAATDDDVDARFDRTRARNRAAQYRLRQRLQAERIAIDRKLHDARRDVTAARERYVALQRQRVEHSTRNANAAVALASMRASQPRSPAEGAAAAVLHTADLVSRTAVDHAAPALCPTSGPCPSTRTKHSGPQRGSSGMDAGGPHATHRGHSMLTCDRKRRNTFTLQQPWTQPPRPIAAFNSVAGISYNDLRAATDPAARLIDFSQHAIPDIAMRVFASKAKRLGAAQAQSRGDVCWFVQTPYEVAEGTPLSVSMSMNSPECIASFGLHYLMSRLEFMLIAAATPCSGGGARRDVTELYRGGSFAQDRGGSDGAGITEDPPPAKLRTPRVSAPAGGARSRCDSASPQATDRQASAPSTDAPTHSSAQHAQHASGASAPSAAVPIDASACRPAATAAPVTTPSVPAPHGPLWSRRVRCGVNETHDAASAVHTILHSVVRSCCQEIPVDSLHRLLSLYHDGLQRMISSFSQPQGQSGGGRGGDSEAPGDGLDGYKARSMAACRGIAALAGAAVGAVSNMHALRQLQAEGRGRYPVDVEGHAAEQRLEAQAHVSMASLALLHHLTLREAPHTVRSLSYHGVFPLFRCDEIDSLHVHLYRGLRLTDEDRARLIAHWHIWSQVSTTLNTPFSSAVATLRSLPQPADIPATLIARVDDVAAGTCVGPVRSSCVGAGARMHRRHACDCSVLTQANDASAGGGEWVAGIQLLGSSVEATVAAEEGLLGLHAVHETHGRVRRETKILQMQPGVLLRPLQLVRVSSAHIPSGTAPVDFLRLCQLAAAQQRWRDMASRPAVLQKPLPKYQWAEGIGVATGAAHCDCQIVGVR